MKVLFGIDLERQGINLLFTALLDDHLHLGTVVVVISAQNSGGVAAVGEEVSVKFTRQAFENLE